MRRYGSLININPSGLTNMKLPGEKTEQSKNGEEYQVETKREKR